MAYWILNYAAVCLYTVALATSAVHIYLRTAALFYMYSHWTYVVTAQRLVTASSHEA